MFSAGSKSMGCPKSRGTSGAFYANTHPSKDRNLVSICSLVGADNPEQRPNSHTQTTDRSPVRGKKSQAQQEGSPARHNQQHALASGNQECRQAGRARESRTQGG